MDVDAHDDLGDNHDDDYGDDDVGDDNDDGGDDNADGDFGEDAVDHENVDDHEQDVPENRAGHETPNHVIWMFWSTKLKLLI